MITQTTAFDAYHFTDKESKTILERAVFLVDTREQSNAHIIDYFGKTSRRWRLKTLESGDYSVMVLACPEIGLHRDIYLDKKIFIERKNSLDELSGNLAQKRAEFNAEFLRLIDADKHLLIENSTEAGIYKHEYMTSLDEFSYMRSLLSFQIRYNIKPHFVPRAYSGQLIVDILEIGLKQFFRLK